MSMEEEASLAQALTALRPDRFAEVRERALRHVEEHSCSARPPSLIDARRLTVLTRATHSSYVLEIGAGLGYGSLHIAAAFGQTGRLDTTEADPVHAALAEAAFRHYALDDRVRVHGTAARQVLPALSGPYDLVVAHERADLVAPLYEDVVRLLRVGGTLFFSRVPGAVEPGRERDLLERLAVDDRVAATFGPGLVPVMATRVR
ncbi:MAG: class I SAM-dependent methyltransferase [Dehalococcoidia bacterium]|nr:class I SAM-dependent methyltransferase [Dehalococcoidia bacterium]